MTFEGVHLVFEGRHDNIGYLREAFVAGQAARSNPDDHAWKGGRGLLNVTFGANSVDVKRGFIEEALTAAGRVECLGYMGAPLTGERQVQARPGGSHYAIVVPSHAGANVTIRPGGPLSVEVAGSPLTR